MRLARNGKKQFTPQGRDQASFSLSRDDQSLNELATRGAGTLWLVVPTDEGVFRESQRVGGFTLACDAQIHLDLLRFGLRGRTQLKSCASGRDLGGRQGEQVGQLRGVPESQLGRGRGGGCSQR